MSDIARALSRPPTYPTKYFGCELGAQTTSDEKNDRYIVNGAHSAERLRELLDGFIDKFVLCGSCKNPETEVIVLTNGRGGGRGEDIVRDCKACGERTGVDMRHKLTTFIVKNPPVKAKKGKRNGDAAAGVGGNGNPDPTADKNSPTPPYEESDDDDDLLTKKIKAEAADLSHDAELSKEDWSADTSPEAVKARVKALESAMASVVVGGGGDDEENDEDDANSPYSKLGSWIEETKANSKDDDPKARSVAIFKMAEELGIEQKHKTVAVLVQALFTEEGVVDEIDQYALLFAKVSSPSILISSYIVTHAPLSDDDLRETPKVSPRRSRAAHRHSLPFSPSFDSQNPHGVVPERLDRRRGCQSVGEACEQKVC